MIHTTQYYLRKYDRAPLPEDVTPNEDYQCITRICSKYNYIYVRHCI